MSTIFISVVCLFGFYEFFELLGILDFTWAVQRSSFHSYKATIEGPAHWVTNNGQHVRNATAADIRVHNKNAAAINAQAARENKAIRRRNRQGVGEGISAWWKAPFLVKYGHGKKKLTLVLVFTAFFAAAYLLKDNKLMFTTSSQPLFSLLLFFVNVLYVVVFLMFYNKVHTRLIGGLMKYDSLLKNQKANSIAALVLKPCAIAFTACYFLMGGESLFFSIGFIVLFVLIFAYMISVALMGERTVEEVY